MIKDLFTTPISKESFSTSWEIVDKERRIVRKKKAISTIASFFSNMVFTVLLFIAINGLIYDNLNGKYCDFLEEIPYLLPTWDKFSSVFLKPEQSWLVQLLIAAFAVYLVCFLVFAVFTLPVSLLYHPLKRKLPIGSEKENAKQLLNMAQDARIRSIKTGNNTPALWTTIFFFAVFFLLSAYGIIVLGSEMEMIKTLLPKADLTQNDMFASYYSQTIMLAAVYLLLITACFILLHRVHALTVRCLCVYHVPYSFVAAVEYYSVFAGENTEGMTEAEIQAKRKETAEAKRKEALYLETINAYGKAKELLAEAAHAGDVQAMEHYARHNLITHYKDPARYWLEKAMDSGNASEWAVKSLRRMKWHLKPKAAYLTEADKVER